MVTLLEGVDSKFSRRVIEYSKQGLFPLNSAKFNPFKAKQGVRISIAI